MQAVVRIVNPVRSTRRRRRLRPETPVGFVFREAQWTVQWHAVSGRIPQNERGHRARGVQDAERHLRHPPISQSVQYFRKRH